MITKLSSLNDIANEFGVPLSTYCQKHFLLLQQQKSGITRSARHGGGKITDWIGYDHSASNEPSPHQHSSIDIIY